MGRPHGRERREVVGDERGVRACRAPTIRLGKTCWQSILNLRVPAALPRAVRAAAHGGGGASGRPTDVPSGAYNGGRDAPMRSFCGGERSSRPARGHPIDRCSRPWRPARRSRGTRPRRRAGAATIALVAAPPPGSACRAQPRPPTSSPSTSPRSPRRRWRGARPARTVARARRAIRPTVSPPWGFVPGATAARSSVVCRRQRHGRRGDDGARERSRPGPRRSSWVATGSRTAARPGKRRDGPGSLGPERRRRGRARKRRDSRAQMLRGQAGVGPR